MRETERDRVVVIKRIHDRQRWIERQFAFAVAVSRDREIESDRRVDVPTRLEVLRAGHAQTGQQRDKGTAAPARRHAVRVPEPAADIRVWAVVVPVRYTEDP